jgi:ferrous iron transport protein A
MVIITSIFFLDLRCRHLYFENRYQYQLKGIIMFNSLGELSVGEKATVSGFAEGTKEYRAKLLAMGLTKGIDIQVTRVAPLGDPVEISVRGFSLSLRRAEANAVLVEKGVAS